MKFLSIDGDDIGRKITSYYLSNNQNELSKLSSSLKDSTECVAGMLIDQGFNIIFCAADGVVASSKKEVNFDEIFQEVNELAPDGITYSAGVGESLRETYIALISAKSNGKNCLHNYAKLDSAQIEGGHV